MPATQRPALAIRKQEVFGVGISAPCQPHSEQLRSLRAEEPHAVVSAFATSDIQRAGGEVCVFDPEAEGLAALLRPQGGLRAGHRLFRGFLDGRSCENPRLMGGGAGNGNRTRITGLVACADLPLSPYNSQTPVKASFPQCGID